MKLPYTTSPFLGYKHNTTIKSSVQSSDSTRRSVGFEIRPLLVCVAVTSCVAYSGFTCSSSADSDAGWKVTVTIFFLLFSSLVLLVFGVFALLLF